MYPDDLENQRVDDAGASECVCSGGQPAVTRRDALVRAAHGFGALALQYLLARDGYA